MPILLGQIVSYEVKNKHPERLQKMLDLLAEILQYKVEI